MGHSRRADTSVGWGWRGAGWSLVTKGGGIIIILGYLPDSDYAEAKVSLGQRTAKIHQDAAPELGMG